MEITELIKRLRIEGERYMANFITKPLLKFELTGLTEKYIKTQTPCGGIYSITKQM